MYDRGGEFQLSKKVRITCEGVDEESGEEGAEEESQVTDAELSDIDDDIALATLIDDAADGDK